MPMTPSSPDVSVRMSLQASQNTRPEVAVRRALRAIGVGYRIHVAVPGKRRRSIDIAFVGPKVAVFIDGCFWHSCPEHGTRPGSNSEQWRAKFARNIERDLDTTAHLEGLGWLVLRFWEHQSPVDVAEQVAAAVAERRRSRPAVRRTAAPTVMGEG
ncbi:very short patch repair endonuclease [Streptacidiphilus pinicola]|uniref:Very short patch repair endonuclease n=1 Tax=Streptacidiphilus pinicola TaxID=2219663 RepID=A0A2X0IFH8_9ACTN|nr:very short patch repair endonuclease [Streptacidiphilus pinicola]RAG83794.1 very short patch repair endonuclease [Streptacidiphilus pinicola]